MSSKILVGPPSPEQPLQLPIKDFQFLLLSFSGPIYSFTPMTPHGVGVGGEGTSVNIEHDYNPVLTR